jgi:hypothetical protein
MRLCAAAHMYGWHFRGDTGAYFRAAVISCVIKLIGLGAVRRGSPHGVGRVNDLPLAGA